jgi:hypothetical protein
MIQFFYGHTETNGRVPLPPQARSQPAKVRLCKIYAWHQPPKPDFIYHGLDHPGDKAGG